LIALPPAVPAICLSENRGLHSRREAPANDGDQAQRGRMRRMSAATTVEQDGPLALELRRWHAAGGDRYRQRARTAGSLFPLTRYCQAEDYAQRPMWCASPNLAPSLAARRSAAKVVLIGSLVRPAFGSSRPDDTGAVAAHRGRV
jgi:hypothetical protein